MRVRAYQVRHHANPGKVAAVAEMLPAWQRGMVHVQVLMVRGMRAGRRPGFMDTKALPGYLTQRQWKSVVNQVAAALRSWQEQITSLVRPLINDLRLDQEQTHRLHRLNVRHQWWGHPVLEPMVRRLARTCCSLPDMHRCTTMLMDSPIVRVQARHDGKPGWWVRIALPGGGVWVPADPNPHMDAAPGQVAQYAQVTVRDGTMSLRLVKKSTPAPPRATGTTLGLDWGVACLLTDSEGRRWGQRLHAWLLERDQELTSLAARLQSQGIRPRDSRRYRSLTHRIRAYVDNEVGRVLNRITDQDVAHIVVEDLDLRGGGLSARMNRIVTRAGRSVLRRRLATHAQDQGITVTAVNPAHTSTTCSGCGYTHKTNRTSQARFTCRFCSKTIHADVNAARNIKDRRSAPTSEPRRPPWQVLDMLDQEFTTQWGTTPPGRHAQRHPRPHSRATTPHTVAGGHATTTVEANQQR